MPQRDDYFNGAGSVGRPCGGGRDAATMGRRPWAAGGGLGSDSDTRGATNNNI